MTPLKEFNLIDSFEDISDDRRSVKYCIKRFAKTITSVGDEAGSVKKEAGSVKNEAGSVNEIRH